MGERAHWWCRRWSMWLFLAAFALADGPQQACAADGTGKLAMIAPRDGRLFAWTDGKLVLVAQVPLPSSGQPLGVVVGNPSGGWWVGVRSSRFVDAAGKVKELA